MYDDIQKSQCTKNTNNDDMVDKNNLIDYNGDKTLDKCDPETMKLLFNVDNNFYYKII